MIRAAWQAARVLRVRQFALQREACALCAFGFTARLAHDETAVRCPRCGASAITQSLVDVLSGIPRDLSRVDACELSSRGGLMEWLAVRARSLMTSEYFEGVTPGQVHEGVTCQDVQRLSYADASFDLCTSTEVFEHVEDDAAGFRELFRVLRPRGWLVFTVPLDPDGFTLERTQLQDGCRRAILPAEYHTDSHRGHRVLCYRHYGADILDRLRAAGFIEAALRFPVRRLFGFARPVVVARKAG
jgi:SAM-dependent methyltransferase